MKHHPVRFVRAAVQRSVEARPPAGFPRARWQAAAALTVLASVALCLIAHHVAYFASDVTITRDVQALDLHALSGLFYALNALGFPPTVDIVYGGTLLWIERAGKRWEAIAGLVGVTLSAAINEVSKVLVGRPRPDPRLVHVDHAVPNPSFPAGHVLDFTMFAGYLIFLLVLYARPTWKRHVACVLLVALMLLMGLARIHSGEHWFSDVLGGYVIGGASLTLCVLFYDGCRRAGVRHDPSPVPLPIAEPGVPYSRRQP